VPAWSVVDEEAPPAARRPIPVAVVTSGSTEPATARLRGAGPELPAMMITADAIARGKPDPEPFLLGARALGVRPAAASRSRTRRAASSRRAPPACRSSLSAPPTPRPNCGARPLSSTPSPKPVARLL
jgi:hypothetical protein